MLLHKARQGLDALLVYERMRVLYPVMQLFVTSESLGSKHTKTKRKVAAQLMNMRGIGLNKGMLRLKILLPHAQD